MKTTPIQAAIQKLEAERDGIERAIAVLRQLEPTPGVLQPVAEATPRKHTAKKAAKKAVETPANHISPSGRKKLAEAMRKRWAVKKAAGGSGPIAKSANKNRG
jgi:hypothetical protein